MLRKNKQKQKTEAQDVYRYLLERKMVKHFTLLQLEERDFGMLFGLM